ncbi:MAG TPA: DUF6797 domain-containing protein, partial [Planctomycetota bacterium]|nr:DUF6797 domain-containing protein [Planctomycetota bacterium]
MTPLRCAVLIAATGALAAAELAPGLVAVYHERAPLVDGWPHTTGRTPALVRVEPTVDHASTAADFAGAKFADEFSVVWSGVLRIAVAGRYAFAIDSDDGSRLSIDGAVVVDNGGLHGMAREEGAVELAVGDHPIRIEYFEAAGDAAMRVRWKPPGAEPVILPPEALLHDPASAAIAWDETAWNAREAPTARRAPWEAMDYGPFVSASIDSDGPHRHVANKGIAIRLDQGLTQAAVLFDTDLLQYSAGWTGGWLHYRGLIYDGGHGQNPQVAGEIAFSSPASPGCADPRAAVGSFADPRPQPYGPLPRDWARWRGLHLDGQRVTLSYDLGTASVAETPSLIVSGAHRAFARAMDVGPGGRDLRLSICALPDAQQALIHGDRLTLISGDEATVVAVVGAATGVALRADAGRIVLDVPAAGARLTLVIWHGAADARDAALEAVLAQAPGADDVRARIARGGAPRWTTPAPLTTVGALGSGDGAYVVDTLTLPEDNPWSSWLRPGGLDLFSDNRIAFSTWSGDVWVVSGVDATLGTLTWRRFAAGLFQPLGLKIVDDVVHVHGRDQITRLKDLDGDGEADLYECFNNDVLVTPNFHEFSFDLHTDAAGDFWFVKGGPVRGGGRGFDTVTASHGCVFRVAKDGSSSAVYATGVRAP